MTPQDRPAQRDNPFARLDNHGHTRRLGTTPAATGPTESVYTSLRITVERGKGYQAYRLFGSGSYVFFPCLGNTLLKPLVGEARPEDDLKINWRVKWFTDQHGHKTIMRVCDATSGEVLASTQTQPALLDVTVDESTGQLTTAKLDPFGKPFDPIRARMFQLVNAARGSECDYDWTADHNDYPHDTEVIVTMKDIADKDRERQANEAMQQTLATAEASADYTPAPDTKEAPTRSELDAHFGPKEKKPVALSADAHWSEHGGVALFWSTVFHQNEVDRKEEPEARRAIITVLGSRPNEWPDYDTCLHNAEDAIYAMRNERIAAAKPEAAKTASKGSENTADGSGVPAVENGADLNRKPGLAVEVSPIPSTQPKPAKSMALVPTGDSKWDVMTQQAQVMLKSGFMPQSIKSAEQVLTIAMMGEALGIAPIVAINNINVIQGKPTVSPQLMLALIRRSGQLEDMQVEDDGTVCTVTMKRKGETAHVERFSQSDAVTMGLAGKDNWRKQPAVMRKWRAVSAACRIVFPDLIWGLYTTEELAPDTIVVEAA